MTKNRKFLIGFIALIVVLSAFIGGGFVAYTNRPAIEKIGGIFGMEPQLTANRETVDFEPFWDAWNTLESKYVSNNGMDRQKMVWGAIAGLAKSMDDPYTVFFPPQKAEEFKEEMSGNFQGVGMEIGIRDDMLTVVAPLKDTPAEKAGIKPGDRILKIDNADSVEMSVEKAVSLIRGPKGTEVTLLILHKKEKESKEIKITRDVIQIPVIKTEEKEGDIFVIKMYSFSGNSTELFKDALKKFVFSGKNKLILDLRGNPGGYLESSVDIASWFLPAGKIVAREKFSDGEETLFRSKGYDIFKDIDGGLPFVILVNEGSASASEILAGALREHGIAKLIGTKTFGKGSVQELVDINGGGSLKVTIARWLTPNGNSISEKGIEPDYKVEINGEELAAEKDPQMDKAVEILKEMKNR